MTATDTFVITRPTVRARLNYSETVKEGWRFESTVEMVFSPIDDGGVELQIAGMSEIGVAGIRPWTNELERLSIQANETGQTEVNRLNQLRAQRAMVPA